MFKIGFCISGKGRLFKSAISHKKEVGFEPGLVILDEKADLQLEQFCSRNDIKWKRISSSNRKNFDTELSKHCIAAQLDLISLTFDKLVPFSLIEAYPNRIINVHMSLLPAYKGFGAIKSCLEDGVRFTGATIHLVDESVDGGDIIGQCCVPASPSDTTQSLGKKIYIKLEPLYLQVLRWYVEGRVLMDARGRPWIQGAQYNDELYSPNLEGYFRNLALS